MKLLFVKNFLTNGSHISKFLDCDEGTFVYSSISIKFCKLKI